MVFVPQNLRDAFNQAIPENDLRDFGNLIPDAIGGPDGGGIDALNARYDFLAGAGAFGTAPALAPRGTNLNPIGRDLIRVAVLPDMLRLDIDADPNDLAIGQFGFQNGRRLGDIMRGKRSHCPVLPLPMPGPFGGIVHVPEPATKDENRSRASRPCHIFTGIIHVPEPATKDENAAARSDKLQFVADWTRGRLRKPTTT
jgi:hypothetical protein